VVAAVERLLRMLELLEAGEIGAGTLGHLVHTVSVLSVEQARGHTRQQIIAKTRRLVLKVDPDGVEARAGKRRTERRVEIEPDEDGMSTLGCGNLGPNCRYCDRAFRPVRGNLGPNCGTPRRRAQLPGPTQRHHPEQHAARRRDPPVTWPATARSPPRSRVSSPPTMPAGDASSPTPPTAAS
jgi:hypothetical protein